MKYQAVIFDLFGTLVDIVSEEENKRVLREMASVINAPPDRFINMWQDTITKRMTGEFSDYQDCIRYISHDFGITVESSLVEQAASLRVKMEEQELTPREHAIELLSYLKGNKIKTGLISGCSSIVPTLWPRTPFSQLIDVPIFSCYVGIMKPDPRIYLVALKRLAVNPRNCLYIADGIGQELKGASKLGMDAVMIRTPKDDPADPHREEWGGEVISSLKEVLTLL
jgi:putative hydrolase of the HAD superfamily